MQSPELDILIGVFFAVILGAAFSAVEAGLNALGEVGLRAIGDGTGPHARVAKRALRSREAIQSRLLGGSALCLSTAAALAAYVAWKYDGPLAAAGAGWAVAIFYAATVEVATTAACRRAGPGALRMLRWLRPLEVSMVPLAVPLSWLRRLTERLVPAYLEGDAERITELQVEHVIEQGEESGLIPEDHAALLRSVLEFRNTVAREVMVPRTHMIAFEVSSPVAEVLETIVAEGHSRYPVFRERVDQMEGVLYAKDLFAALRDGADPSRVGLASLIRRPVFYAAETEKIGMLLREMQSRRIHMAVVVDEFGGTSGLVTLEDIVEEIVGEIQDEHDEEPPRVRAIEAGHYLVDAGMSVYDLQDELGERIVEEEGDYDSLGGMVTELAGRVPSIGESVPAGAFELVVREADERHVKLVEVIKKPTIDTPHAAE